MAMPDVLQQMEQSDVTVHGFRSTFRDWAAEATAHPNHVVEQALAHTIGNAVEAAYRRGDLFEKRRHLMNDWAQFCGRPSAGADAARHGEAKMTMKRLLLGLDPVRNMEARDFNARELRTKEP